MNAFGCQCSITCLTTANVQEREEKERLLKVAAEAQSELQDAQAVRSSLLQQLDATTFASKCVLSACMSSDLHATCDSIPMLPRPTCICILPHQSPMETLVLLVMHGFCLGPHEMLI